MGLLGWCEFPILLAYMYKFVYIYICINISLEILYIFSTSLLWFSLCNSKPGGQKSDSFDQERFRRVDARISALLDVSRPSPRWMTPTKNGVWLVDASQACYIRSISVGMTLDLGVFYMEVDSYHWELEYVFRKRTQTLGKGSHQTHLTKVDNKPRRDFWGQMYVM